MCGIWGIYNWRDGEAVDAEQLLRIGHALVHRGPDETGWFVSGPIGLGVHRLRVIDLVSGRQPMANEDRSVTVVFNGEIYNHRELRAKLVEAGHRFTSQSDTEVIVHLYEEEGSACWSRLNGMFAIALWDDKRQVLLLVRDRLGVKPLYYSEEGTRLIFGSELKLLLSVLSRGGEIDPGALSDYLSLNYIPGPHTIIQGIQQVPAGHFLQCDATGLVSHRYWDLQFSTRAWADPVECQGELLRVAREAVCRQMISDVPLGALLSGGVDSSVIVALMAQQSSKSIQTFSIRFAEASYDESRFASQVSELYRTEHHEILCNARECLAWLPRLPYYADNLFADPSLVPTYLVCQAARRSVTVVLSGDGGDELFAGYPTYQADYLLQWYQRIPRWARQGSEVLIRNLPASPRKLSLVYRSKKFLEGTRFPREKAHYWWRTVFTEDEKAKLVQPDLWCAMRSHDPFDAFDRWFANARQWPEPLDQYQYVDVNTWLVDDILVKLDRMSMAHSLEARVPWLDHELVELACTIPASWRMQGLQTKYLFKRAALQLLPRRIVYRKKSGFLPALSTWFQGPWRELLGDTLSESALRRVGWLNPSYVQQLLNDHWGGRADHSFKLWNLLILCWWHQAFGQASQRLNGGKSWLQAQ